MKISDIDILRDGGTILFTLSGTHNEGRYRLQTPMRGEPRPIFLNERQLELGSTAERDLMLEIEEWLHQTITGDRQKALRTLDTLNEWRNLPKELLDVVPLHRMRTVMECLAKRNAHPSAAPHGGPATPTMSETLIKTTEEAIKYLETHVPSGATFQLAISEMFTFAGKPDIIGAGKAVILDKILGLGYMPDGFEQKSGFRLYRYKKMQ